MTTLNEQLDKMIPQWTRLLTELIPDIADEYRCTDDLDDDTPGMCVTIGFTPGDEEKDASWGYQTGDNSYSGAAYFHPHWAVIYLMRDSDPSELAKDAADQIYELVY